MGSVFLAHFVPIFNVNHSTFFFCLSAECVHFWQHTIWTWIKHLYFIECSTVEKILNDWIAVVLVLLETWTCFIITHIIRKQDTYAQSWSNLYCVQSLAIRSGPHHITCWLSLHLVLKCLACFIHPVNLQLRCLCSWYRLHAGGTFGHVTNDHTLSTSRHNSSAGFRKVKSSSRDEKGSRSWMHCKPVCELMWMVEFDFVLSVLMSPPTCSLSAFGTSWWWRSSKNERRCSVL